MYSDEDFEANFNLGILFYDQRATPGGVHRDANKAIHYLKIALSEQKSACALFNLAIIYEEQGHRAQAKEMYQEVL